MTEKYETTEKYELIERYLNEKNSILDVQSIEEAQIYFSIMK